MHPNTRVGSSRGEQMGLGNFQLFRFFTYRHLEHEKSKVSSIGSPHSHLYLAHGVRRRRVQGFVPEPMKEQGRRSVVDRLPRPICAAKAREPCARYHSPGILSKIVKPCAYIHWITPAVLRAKLTCALQPIFSLNAAFLRRRLFCYFKYLQVSTGSTRMIY